jgi:hypothetical protein
MSCSIRSRNAPVMTSFRVDRAGEGHGRAVLSVEVLAHPPCSITARSAVARTHSAVIMAGRPRGKRGDTRFNHVCGAQALVREQALERREPAIPIAIFPGGR